MRSFILIAVLALVAVAASESLFSRLYFSLSPATAKPTTTTTTARTTTTTTTLAPQPEADVQSAPGQYPPNAMEDVMSLMDKIPELHELAGQIFSEPPPPSKNPLYQSLSDLPKDLQAKVNCILDHVKNHKEGTPFDLTETLECPQPAVTKSG